ncbi:CheR family methyltransferase [Asticcacaulis benevestitus]|uniref:Chemotaxis protein methyltransferase n=1 Tax=Asticcacaulis benevestitus DSM 16100 = ATCC BAA-896 TaxID=1121022 RepID=V4RNJ4_9CAUL|nr:protein-glutamate O-methyltransferase [Asticcacaulis benevestitus]ESQ92808.1 hypothetical protein ABENE_06820 [Asticcacaulis benevestitus DSM 16100 = ATCC BAA-896]
MTVARKPDLSDSDLGEFVFTNADFQTIAELVHRHAGIVLGPSKRSMVYSRLSRRLRELNLKRFDDYCRLLQAPEGANEFLAFSNAMTTNLTRFFREKHHFDFLQGTIIPKIKQSADERRLRIWSAGCSSGEEPYSIAMTLLEHFPELSRWDARILATDLDTNMLSHGSKGLYAHDALGDVPKPYHERYFTATSAGLVAKEGMRKLIAFKSLNLLEKWPIKGPFDVIFCRNVMIYFDNPTKNDLVRRYAKLLRVGGWLVVGHSETLLDQQSLFKSCGRTIYQKVGA